MGDHNWGSLVGADPEGGRGGGANWAGGGTWGSINESWHVNPGSGIWGGCGGWVPGSGGPGPGGPLGM